MLLDGKPLTGSEGLEHEPGANTGRAGRINGYFTETYVAEDHLLGWVTLAPGRHTVTFACTGRHADASAYHLGIDTLVLARLSPLVETAAAKHARKLRDIGERRRASPTEQQAIREALGDGASEVRRAAAWSIGQLGEGAAPLVLALVPALRDADLSVRGLAALALRDAGPAAEGALDPLVAALNDPDAGVRMMSAQAIASQGPKAARVLDALIAACRRKDEHVHVQRSLADALGAIGPAARASLPELRALAAIPRVRWAAEAAIKRLEGSR